MAIVEIYTKSWCPYCTRAKAQLTDLGVSFKEIDITTNSLREREMVNRANRTSVPQIFVGDHHVGGSDDLDAIVPSGEFKRILACSEITALVG